MKLVLHDKNGDVVGYEHHLKNEFGVIQIYHELKSDADFYKWHHVPDFNKDPLNRKRLVREGFYIAHHEKYLIIDF